ncbi:MAG: spermine synthase [Methylococcales bacterium]|nr:spermine synthase [Methylococcales bacterium]
MFNHPGWLVHYRYDDEGVIEVVDQGDVRALYFGTANRQSSMLLSSPDWLHSRYAQAMMAWLLFKESCADVFMIGLGGGTLARYLLKRFDDCSIDMVEFRPAMVEIARDYFDLPEDSRLTIHIGDGGAFARQAALAGNQRYDLLMIDAYSPEGMSNAVQGLAFFDACAALMTGQGLLAINLWATHPEAFKQIARQLGAVFDWRVLFLPVRERGNVIGFAFAPDFPRLTLRQLKQRVPGLMQQYGLPFDHFLKDFKSANNKVWNRVISR